MEEELANAIEVVADQLGVAAEHIYEIFVSAQHVIGVLSIVSVVSVMLATIVSTNVVYKLIKSCTTDSDGNWNYDNSRGGAFIYSGAAAFVLTLVYSAVAEVVSVALLKILCPEYSAICEILSLVMGS